MNPRPVEIIGGGLAGLSLGLALRRAGVPVTLYDAGHYPRHRVCGEFIAGLDATTRRLLQLDPLLADARQLHHVAWFHRNQEVRRQRLPHAAVGLSRHALDHRLAEAFVAAGGLLRQEQRAALEPREGRVLAAGRRPAPTSPWIGLKAHVIGLELGSDLEVHLGHDCYVGLSQVEGERVNVCGLFRRRDGLATSRHEVLLDYLRLGHLSPLAERLAGATLDPASCCAVAGLAFAPSPPADDPALNLGDRFALIPPFTGNGMAMALQSAALSLEPLAAWSRGALPWPDARRQIAAALRRRFRLRLRSAGLLHPFLLQSTRQRWLAAATRARLVPLRPLYHALH